MIRIFSVSIATSVLLLLASEILLLFGCYVAAAYLALTIDTEVYLLYGGGLLRITLVVAGIMLGLHFQDLYDDLRPRPALMIVQQLCVTLGAVFLLQALLGYMRLTLQLPHWTMFYGSAMVLVAVPTWRRAYWSLARNMLPMRQLLFLGTSLTALEIMRLVNQRPELGLAVMGYLDADQREFEEVDHIPFLGPLRDVERVVKQQRPDELVIGLRDPDKSLPTEELLTLRQAGVHIEEAASVYESLFGRVSTRDLQPSQMILRAGPRALSLGLHYTYSYLLAVAGLAIAWPVMAVVAVLVKLSSPGPVLFRQKRVGLNGKTFMLLKFRSMKADAEADTGAVWAQLDDPRVTPVGRWLRKLRLDELPQLFNVIRGEMSLIGPRPERPEFVSMLAEKIQFYNQRHRIKPGITGWAQINHKYGDTVADAAIKLQYDLYYIKNLTPAFDALIVFHTLKVALLQRGSQ